jgi:ABC-2 type transport system ATP-binding protein
MQEDSLDDVEIVRQERLTHPDQESPFLETDFVVETDRLTKRYGRRLAVDDLTLRIVRGEIYGFLGLNGSGKTTTMRMLLGLVRPTSGAARVLGQAPGRPQALRTIGSLVESPTFYPYLSGRDNLRLVARLAGVDEARVADALELVSLADRARDAFRTYSLGMKQRLGVAATLVKDPELYILDEPTNGLDPEGILDMGRLIASLRARGRTVFLSSHQLTEVEGLADRIGIMRRGRMVAEGTVAELQGKPCLLIRAEPLEQARRVLEAEAPGCAMLQDGAFLLRVDPARAPSLNRALTDAGIAVTALRCVERSLTDVFFELNDLQAEGAPDHG